jgi:TfoX/Sxy family transcriptional regulator of competence genes
MAYDEQLASRVRRVLAREGAFAEKAMFGGLAFLLGGRMCCGILGDRLMVRVDPDTYDALLRDPHASPMDFSGRAMRGFIFLDRDGVATAAALRKWVARAVTYVAAQPPKVVRRRPTPRTPAAISKPAARRV